MAYIGKVKERLSINVTLINSYNYEKPAFGYGVEYHTIYIFEDEGGNVLKWDTTSSLSFDTKTLDKNDCPVYVPINKGDVIAIKATVKEHREYKGIEQTVVNRVVINKIIEQAETEAEREERMAREKAEAKAKQLETLEDGDELYTMKYSQYKKHYSDCETVIGSFENEGGCALVTVIVRAGRMKASGVRGKRFNWYPVNVDGVRHEFYAVSKENAIKQAKKEYKQATKIEMGKW